MAHATTLKLPEELKSRISAAAAEAGKTPHAFMIEALTRQTEAAERRREFVSVALAAEQEVAADGLVYDAEESFAWLRGRLTGDQPLPRPAPRPASRRA
jgi:predicted transcriptional regulator